MTWDLAVELIRDQMRVLQTRVDSLEQRAALTDRQLAADLSDLRAQLRNLGESIAGLIDG